MTSDYGQGTYGGGTFGGTGTTNPLNLRVKNKTSLSATLEWDLQIGVQGYRLFKNGSAISSSWQTDKTTWRVSYNKGDVFEVVPIISRSGSKVVL